MERIRDTKTSGISRNALHTWGIFFLALGILGRSIFQNQLLGMGSVTAQQLLEAMQSSETMMLYATLGLVLQAVETCALPIFAFLLVEGVQKTSNFWNYFFRVLGVAALSEIPYNLAMSGKLFNFSSRNPAFGLVLAMIAIYFYGRYTEKSIKNTLVKPVVTLAAILWGSMLSIEYGGCMVLVAAVLWAFRTKPMMRNIAGATATILGSLYSLFMMAAPMGFLAIHFYNGEKGEENRLVNYLAYPVILLAVGLAGAFLL